MPSPLSVLANISCASVLSSRPVSKQPVIIPASETLSKACHILANASVTSAPVFSQTDHSFVGFLDCMDILQLIVKQHEHNFLDPWLDSLLSHNNVMDATSGQVAALSPDHEFESVNESTTLEVVCQKLIGSKNSLCVRHRLPVTDQNGSFIGVISQSDIIKVLYNHRSEFPTLMNAKASALGLGLQGENNLVTCDAESSLLSCLKIMVKEKVSSVGLVDEENHILMNFSLSDSKHLLLLPNAEALNSALERSVGDFKSNLIRSHISAKDSSPVFVVSTDATVEHTIGKIVATHTHRIYVCKDHIAQGLISITDILRVICSE